MTSLRRSATTQALIDLEDAAPAVLDARIPGSPSPLWLQVRMQFATLLSENELGDATVPVTTSTARALGRLARSVLPDRADAALWRGKKDIVFVVGGTTVHQRNGRARNWLVGAYAEALPGASIIIQRRALASPLGRAAFMPTRSLDPGVARAELGVALRRGRRSPVDHQVRELITEFARLLGLSEDPRLPDLVTSAVWAERVRPRIAREFAHFLDHVRPRILLFEDASYGSEYATLVALARARGVIVAEPQHGWIGPAHPAYNYGAAMHRAHNSIALPEVLLTFGAYWGEDLSHPGAAVPIGKPHLEERVVSAPELHSRAREVLIVSSVAQAEVTMQFVRDLRIALPSDWSIRFRPHPSERAVLVSRYPGLFGIPGVILDERADVYDSLSDCQVVVGVASTVLFEAAALGCRVFVRDSPYVPYVVGGLFGEPLRVEDGIDRILNALREDLPAREGRPAVEVTSLWRPKAVANFKRWVDAETTRHQ